MSTLPITPPRLLGIQVRNLIGIGDAIQFTSVPENYFRHTGQKMADLDHHWVFDHNPFVLRNIQKVDEEFNLWHLHCNGAVRSWKDRTVLLSSAEAHSRYFGYPMVLNRPRLYKFEGFPFDKREMILLHTWGRSHGRMPEHVVKHVIDKYGGRVHLVGHSHEWDYQFNKPTYIPTKSMWDLAEVISKARMFIGVDSGPSWIAQCYPDVVTKKVRLIPKLTELHNWIPLEMCRLNSHWDDRSAGIYNISEDDIGFTWSYRRI